MDKNCPGREGQRKKPIKVGGCEKVQCVQWTEFGLAEVRREMKRGREKPLYTLFFYCIISSGLYKV